MIGGGILGVQAAALAAKRGWPVVLVRRSDRRVPQADTLRNHAWLQSGLLYAGQDLAAAKKMRASSARMFTHFGLSFPRDRGVFQVSSADDAERLIRHASELRIRSQVEEISTARAEQLLKGFYRPGGYSFWVPDAPFDEATLLHAARTQAKGYGVQMFDLEEEIRLKIDSSAPAGVVLQSSAITFAPEKILIAAGAGTLQLLGDLRVDHRIRVYRSALLCTPLREEIAVPLLVDDRGAKFLSVVRHERSEVVKDGALVYGGRDRVPVGNESESTWREVSAAEQNALLDLLPPKARPEHRGIAFRFTAGLKTEGPDPLNPAKPSVAPYFLQVPEFPAIVTALPGKATNSFWTATEGLRRLGIVPKKGVAEAQPVDSEAPSSWSAPIAMHHEDYYDNLNESEPGEKVS